MPSPFDTSTPAAETDQEEEQQEEENLAEASSCASSEFDPSANPVRCYAPFTPSPDCDTAWHNTFDICIAPANNHYFQHMHRLLTNHSNNTAGTLYAMACCQLLSTLCL